MVSQQGAFAVPPDFIVVIMPGQVLARAQTELAARYAGHDRVVSAREPTLEV